MCPKPERGDLTDKTFKEVIAGIRAAVLGIEVREDIAQGMEFVEQFASTAVSKAEEAVSAAAQALSHKNAAASSASAAKTSQTASASSASAAAKSASSAQTSAGNAAASAEEAKTSSDSASASADAAAKNRTAAAASESAAKASAENAAASASDAEDCKEAAGRSEDAANQSVEKAGTWAAAAEASRKAAEESAQAAKTSETGAASSAVLAKSHETQAGFYANAAKDAVDKSIEGYGGGYSRTVSLTAQQNSWTEMETPVGIYRYSADVALEDCTAKWNAFAAVLPASYLTSYKARVSNVIETFDGFVRLYAVNAPDEDIQFVMSVFAVGSKTYYVTAPADGWIAAENAEGAKQWQCDIALEDSGAQKVPMGMVALENTDEALADPCLCATMETFDGFVRVYAMRKPAAAINLIVTLLARNEVT